MTLPPIHTRVAHAGYDDHRYFGTSTLTELLGAETLTGIHAMAVSGRRLDRSAREMLDDLAVIITVADPRIWPLKLTRVLASYGGTIAAYAGAQLCLEGELLGPWSTLRGAEQWAALHAAIGDDTMTDAARIDAAITDHLARNKRLAGYGVPFRDRDERQDALRERVMQRGWHERPFWRLQEAFSRRVHVERGLAPNAGAGASAMLLDMGFTVPQVPAIMTVLMQNNFVANAVEGATQAPAVLRSLPPEGVNYAGPSNRRSPRAP